MADDDRAKAMSLWPLALGRKASFGHALANGRSEDGSEVIAIENVTVPAGTFQAHVVTTTMTDGPYSSGKRMCWYVPEIGFCARLALDTESKRRGKSSQLLELKEIRRP